jgi:hypothetical protein
MKEVRDWLTAGDPVASEPTMSDAEVQRMRHTVLAAGDSPQSLFADWARGSWAAATVMVAFTIAVGVSRWFTPLPDIRTADVRNISATTSAVPGARRQVQLIAPNGTRVIWIFNADFEP